MWRSTAAAAAMGIGLAAGCRSVTPQTVNGQLANQIQDGVTNREQALLMFGTPAAAVEGDRILAYRVWQANPGARVRPTVNFRFLFVEGSTGLHEPSFSLVLVFDDRGILAEHTVVAMK